MQLARFLNTYVDHNAIVRLWYAYPEQQGHIIALEENYGVCMAWEVTQGTHPAARFAKNDMVKVFSVLDPKHPDVINIEISREKVKR